jgi:hypothetical protein
MPPHTIVTVRPSVREWQSQKGGPMKSYRVDLKAADGTVTENVEWARKADSPPPAADQSINCTIDPRPGNDFGPKLALDQGAGFGGNGYKGRSPEETRQIVRQHSQHMALLYVQAKAAVGALPADFKPSDLTKIVDWFDADALEKRT